MGSVTGLSPMIGIALGLALLVADASLAQTGGTLPKGDLEILDRDKVTPPKTKATKAAGDPRCRYSFAALTGGNGLFADGGSTFYLLAQDAPVDLKADAKPDMKLRRSNASRFRQVLVRLALEAEAAETEAILSFEHRAAPALVAYGRPVKAISAVAFFGNEAPCLEGAGGMVSIAFGTNAEKAVRSTGQFQLVETPFSRQLVDTKKRALLDLDPVNFQARMARVFAPREQPLHFDPDTRSLVVWHEDDKVKGLIAYANESDAKPRRLAVSDGDTIVQAGAHFAVARVTDQGKALELSELPTWSGLARPGTYKIRVPASAPLATAAVQANFAKRIALVYGSGPYARRKWGRVFVYDYAKDQLIKDIAAPANTYPHFVGLDPHGTKVVVEFRDVASRLSRELLVFDIKTRKARSVALPRAVRPEVKTP